MNRLRTIAFVLLIAAVVVMSMFPKAPGTGTFQSTNGPTTDFAAWRAAMLVTIILLAAGKMMAGRHVAAIAHVRTADPSLLSCTMLC